MRGKGSVVVVDRRVGERVGKKREREGRKRREHGGDEQGRKGREGAEREGGKEVEGEAGTQSLTDKRPFPRHTQHSQGSSPMLCARAHDTHPVPKNKRDTLLRSIRKQQRA